MQMIHCTYLISPDTNNTSVDDELSNIDRWASSNNLKLNKTKSQEMIVYSISKSKDARVLPKLLTDIVRVDSIKILGVTVCMIMFLLSVNLLFKVFMLLNCQHLMT